MPLTREQIIASLIYWGIWVFGMFLIPEILGLERIAPWVTFSETDWWLQKTVPLVASGVFGFGIGLIVHLRYGTPFARAEIGGLLIAVIVHVFWGLE